MEKSLDDLFSELEDIQSMPSETTKSNDYGVYFSNENAIELMGFLMQTKRLENVHITSTKEYVTESKLVDEIKEQVSKSGGRIPMSMIEAILGIDNSIIGELVKRRITEDDEKNYLIIPKGGEYLMSHSYVESVSEEIVEFLEEVGHAKIDLLCEKFNLDLSCFDIYFLPILTQRGNQQQINGSSGNGNNKKKVTLSNKRILYTAKYIKRQEYSMCGFFSSLDEPYKFSGSLEETFDLDESFCSYILKNLISRKRILGKLHDGVIFIPQVFEDKCVLRIEEFINSNHYLVYKYCMENFIHFSRKKDMLHFLRKRFKHLRILKNLATTKTLALMTSIRVEEAVSGGCVLDLSDVCPFDLFHGGEFAEFFDSVNAQLPKNCRRKGSSSSSRTGGSGTGQFVRVMQYIVPESVLEKCRARLRSIIDDSFSRRKTKKWRKKSEESSSSSGGKGLGGNPLQNFDICEVLAEVTEIEDEEVLEELKEEFVVHDIREYFKRVEEGNRSMMRNRSEEKKKMKSEEANLVDTFFLCCTLETSLNSIKGELRGDLEKFYLKKYASNLIKMITDIKIAENGGDKRKIPSKEQEQITELHKLRSLNDFVLSFKATCLQLSIFLAAFTKKKKRKFINDVKAKHRSTLVSLCEDHVNEEEVIDRAIPAVLKYVFSRSRLGIVIVEFNTRLISPLMSELEKFVRGEGAGEIVEEVRGVRTELVQFLMRRREREEEEEEGNEVEVEFARRERVLKERLVALMKNVLERVK